jgi:hypothetical protein
MFPGVNCVRAGSCVGVGTYNDAAFKEEPMAAAESGGRWARAVQVTSVPAAGELAERGQPACRPALSLVHAHGLLPSGR